MNYPYQRPDELSARQPNDLPRLGEAPFPPTRPEFFIPVATPRWTHILIGCNLAVFVAVMAYGYLVYKDLDGSTNLTVLTDMGAKVNGLIAQGQVWRLFTAMFLHIGVIHLLFNLYALNSLGPLVEGFFGHRRFLAIYLLGGLFGSLASYAFSAATSAGASGAIFGLIGAATVYFLRYQSNFGARGRSILQNMLVVIAINLIFGLSMPGIDNWGHIGGLIGGALLAWGLLPRYRTPTVVRLGPQPMAQEAKTGLETLWVVGGIALLWLGTQLVTNGYLESFSR